MDDATLKQLQDEARIAWRGFTPGKWRRKVNVRDFIQANYTPYEGDEKFLAGVTEKSKNVWSAIEDDLFPIEREKGFVAVEENIAADVDAFKPGYISDEDDVIVGLQTDAPLKLPIMPLEGWRSVEKALDEKGIAPNPLLKEIYTKYTRTHNDLVFSLYTPQIRKCRKSHILSALPDNAARGRLIGDYRRVALYGIDFLITKKNEDLVANATELEENYNVDLLCERKEIQFQIKALNDLKSMAKKYGFDISRPAQSAKEAVQWLYFGYLGAIKQQDGAAMSVGKIDAFLDIYIQRDLDEGRINEKEAQELIDQLTIKLRIVRFLRMSAFDAMYTGNPIWATVTLGGTGLDGRTLVTKTSFRLLQTLRNLGPSPEPNLTVLYSEILPDAWKKFCAELSIETSTIQYENDELIRPEYGDDTAIACCVSPVPKSENESIQLFGARMNGAKGFLYGLNGGRDELTGEQIFDIGKVPAYLKSQLNLDGTLDYDTVWAKHFVPALWELTKIYVQALNIIHYSHDRTFYEGVEMALTDTKIKRTMGCGLAGFSHIVDSLSAIKYAQVRPIFDETGLIVDFETVGEFPCFGNDDDRADDIARAVASEAIKALRAQKMYRNAEATLSLLTITANVEYGKKTGNMPDGRRSGVPVSPGANPSNQKDTEGIVASMYSVGKIPFDDCRDGISLTTTIIPSTLGETETERIAMLVNIMDKMFTGKVDGEDESKASHLYHSNINVMTKELMQDAFDHPNDPKYNNLCVRISGYCVRWTSLSQEQRLDILNRTFHATT
ncbi:MAG: formate acetyltransferase [Bifidobacteriaceae bacterium]|jgi:formate C-acetyltransferase|nr:formate acetyltransferase [Bifidobacteriaceae bacterium]